MLDPQYAIARTWSRSSRLMKSGTQEYEAIRSCSYFTNTRRLLKFLHLPVCIQACCLWGDTWACTSPPTPHSSFNEKENQIGTAPYPPTVGPPISPPPRYVPPCLFWPSGGIKTCMLGVIQSCHSQRSEKAHRYPAGLLLLYQHLPHWFMETCHKSCMNWSWLIHKGYSFPLRCYQCSHWQLGKFLLFLQIWCKNQ